MANETTTGSGLATASRTKPGWSRASSVTTGVAETAGAANLASIFSRQAVRTPNAVAVEFEDAAITYGELDVRTNRLARAIEGKGVGVGSVVAISMERSIEAVAAVLGVMKAGAAYVPIDPAYPAARRQYMLEDSQAALLLTQESIARGNEESNTPIMLLGGDRMGDLESFSADAIESVATGENTGYVIYTSGSTGKPKGVAMPQRALANLIEWQCHRPDFLAGARVLQFSSLSFDVSFQELFSTWASGGTLVLIDEETRRVAAALHEFIRSRSIQRIFLPYVALRGLCEAALEAGGNSLELREVYTAGEQLQVDKTLRHFFNKHDGCLLENQYGPTEAHVVTAYRLQGPPADWPTLPPIGRPIANTEIHILDKQMQPVPVGESGELFIGGLCLASGYSGREELTAERFVSNPFSDDPTSRLYRSGDLATLRDDGEIIFHGRMDRQKKFRGYRIEPGEISAALSGHADVAHGVVVIREMEHGGDRLIAYYVLRDGAEAASRELRDHLRGQLPDYMVPTHFVRVDELPLTPSGKVDEKSLPEPVFDRAVLSADFMPARNDTERILVWIWSRLLGVTDIGVHDDFFDLGGTSLVAAEMLNDVRKEFGGEIPLGALAQAPTVAALAEVVTKAAKSPAVWDSLVSIQPSGDRTPFFCVHGGAGNVGSFPLLARQLPQDQPFHALQWDGLDGSRGCRSVSGMAKHYLKRVRTVQPKGPYLLGGHCIGGVIAMEMARLLLEAGERVEQLVLFDSPNLSSPEYKQARDYSFWEDTKRQAGGRKRRLWIWFSSLFRLRVAPENREMHAIMAAVDTVWKHEVRVQEIPTLLIATGLTDGEQLGLNGSWPDGVMGWSPYASDTFSIHTVEAGHNEVFYHPESVKLVVEALDRAHNRVDAEGKTD